MLVLLVCSCLLYILVRPSHYFFSKESVYLVYEFRTLGHSDAVGHSKVKTIGAQGLLHIAPLSLGEGLLASVRDFEKMRKDVCVCLWG